MKPNPDEYKVGPGHPPLETRFGGERANPRGHGFFKKEDTPRYKIERLLPMSDKELEEVAHDKNASRFEQVIALAIHKGDIKTVLELVNQVYGTPKQQVEQIKLEAPKPLIPLDEKKDD